MRKASPGLRFGSRRTAVAFCLAASLGVTAPAGADRLVTREGAIIETKGPWKVEGKRVVFTAADGTLASLRLTEVDLDASHQATAAAENAGKTAAAAPAPKKKSVRVLTDKDFSRSEPAPETAAPEAPAASGAGESSGESQPVGPVQVASWAQVYDQELRALVISGSLRNTGPDLAGAIGVTVRLYDDRDQQLAERPASLDTRTLKPGQNTGFKAVFPGLAFFEKAKFEVQALPLILRKTPPPTPSQPAEEPPPPP